MYKFFLRFFQFPCVIYPFLLLLTSAIAADVSTQKTQVKQESLFAEDAKIINEQEKSQKEKEATEVSSASTDMEFAQTQYQGGMHTIVFDFKTQEKVCLASFYLDGSLWLVFDRYKRFGFKTDEFFTEFVQIPHPKFTILRITHINSGAVLNCKKNGGVWYVRLGGVEINNSALALTETKNTIVGLNNFSYNKYLDLKILGHPPMRVIPLLSNFGRVNPNFHSNFLNFLPARNGIVFELPRYELTTTLTRKKIELVQNDRRAGNFTPLHISEEMIEEAKNANSAYVSNSDVQQQPEETQYKQELISILPDQAEAVVETDASDATTKNSYFAQVRKFQEKIDLADSSEDAFNLIVRLINFHFLNGDYYSVEKRIDGLSRSYTDLYRKNFRVQFIRAVNSSMLCRFSEADKLFLDLLSLSQNLPIYREVLLWYNYNKYKMNPHAFSGLLGIKDEVIKLLDSYNDNLYWPLFLTELELCIDKKDYVQRGQLLQNARVAQRQRDKNALTYLKAYYLNENDDKVHARSLLKSVLLSQHDPRNMQRAWLLDTRIRLDLELIKPEKAIDILNAIQFLWRGDVLATNVLLYLADLQEKVGQYPQALRNYAKIIDYVPYTNLLAVREKIYSLLSRIFLADESESTAIRDFELVTLFDEFQRFLPQNESGDQMVLSIAQRLENLGLLPQTEKLLLHQIKYRAKEEQRVVIANQLSRLYIKMQEYQKAIEILNKTDLNNLSFALYQDRQALRIELLVKLGKYSEALKYVKGSNQEQFLDLKKELFFALELWQEYIDLMRFMHTKGIALSQGDVLHLAIAYYNLGDSDGLDEVVKDFQITDEEIKRDIELLRTTVSSKTSQSIKTLMQ